LNPPRATGQGTAGATTQAPGQGPGPRSPRYSHWWLARQAGVAVLVVLVYWWASAGIEFNVDRLLRGLGQLWTITRQMFYQPGPDWNYFPTVFEGLVESFNIALLGTTLAAVLAIPFGFLAATNLAGRTGAAVGKLCLNAIRAFPELLLAIVFMRGVGPGAFAGILAIGIHSIGMLGKLYAEVVEAIDRQPVEALQAAGANRLLTAWYAIVPQVLPDFASYAIYRFEINVRAATVVGLVGAGGIGKSLYFQLLAWDWSKVGLILLSIIVAVSVVDYLSATIRSRIV